MAKTAAGSQAQAPNNYARSIPTALQPYVKIQTITATSPAAFDAAMNSLLARLPLTMIRSIDTHVSTCVSTNDEIVTLYVATVQAIIRPRRTGG